MANKSGYKPYIDPNADLKELTIPPLVLGALMSIVLGAANVYLGLKAGMTVAAVFPAAVISMAVLRIFKSNILEENIARTTGAVGEALAAGAIFTVPAFVIVGAWDNIDVGSSNWFMATALLAVGGVLGVMFVILLRRTFVEDASLPFPESAACTEIVKAGQGGQSGAGTVFGSMALAGILEFFKNGAGVKVIGGYVQSAFTLGDKGTFPLLTPNPSPAFLAVGYIIGPKYGAITASGGIFGWMFLMPIVLYMMSMQDAEFAKTLTELVDSGKTAELFDGVKGGFIGLDKIYSTNIKMIAIGAMIVSAFYTLYGMRANLIAGLKRSFSSLNPSAGKGEDEQRTDKDLNIKVVLMAIGAMVVAMFLLYQVLCGSMAVSLVMTVVMAIAGFLFAAVAGFLVSIIGSSSNPISGLTLSTLLLAAGLLVLLGMGGGYEADGVTMTRQMATGVLAVLGVATVVCCVAGVAGDMAQDWKVGHNLGGTPWRMEVGGIIGVLAASLVLVVVITLLHSSDISQGVDNKCGRTDVASMTPQQKVAFDKCKAEVTKTHGIGGKALPAPQAGLMAVMAKGIISGALAWELILIGVFFAIALIFIGAPSPMLIAVGMYLPFPTTMAIFLGGVFKWVTDSMAKKQGVDDPRVLEAIENKGLLVASGFVAGEALMGLCLAALVAAQVKLTDGPVLTGSAPYWLGGLVIIGLAIFMVTRSLSAIKDPLPPAADDDDKKEEKEDE